MSSDVVAVVHRVHDVVAAVAFFERVLWMKKISDDRLTSGALELRLLPLGLTTRQPTLELEVTASSAAECASALLKEPHARLLPEPPHPTPERIELVVQMEHGVVVRVVRVLDEDEQGVLPDLPIALAWEPEAVSLVKTTLRVVPLAFRALARKRMTESAESEARAAGATVVDVPLAVRGMMAATPAFQLPTLREALQEAGAL